MLGRRLVRKLGHLPDQADERDLDFAALGFGSSTLPAEHRILTLAQEQQLVIDQGATNSCVAHAFTSAIMAREILAGRPAVRASRTFVYWNGRALAGIQDRDLGSHPRMVAKGLERFGAPDEDVWPFRPGLLGNINRQPTWPAYSRAHPRRLGLYARIFERDDARVLAVRAALAAGYPVEFGALVSTKIFAASGPHEIEQPAPGDEIAGGHSMLCLGYRTAPDGRIWFRVLNSWGRDWRDVGLCWVSADYIASAIVFDLWIVKEGRPL